MPKSDPPEAGIRPLPGQYGFPGVAPDVPKYDPDFDDAFGGPSDNGLDGAFDVAQSTEPKEVMFVLCIPITKREEAWEYVNNMARGMGLQAWEVGFKREDVSDG